MPGPAEGRNPESRATEKLVHLALDSGLPLRGVRNDGRKDFV
jgi:hypothetical protein